MLEVCNVSKSYANKKVIEKISFDIKDGEIVALIGKNGAGKTTILNTIAGNIYPSGGSIIYNNYDILKNGRFRNEFGVLIEGTFFEYMDVNCNLTLLLNAIGLKDKKKIQNTIDKMLVMVGLEKQKYSKVKSFSFGMKQRLGLAQALITDISFLMLDEPFVGLDPIGKEIFKNVIKTKAREDKVGVLFSSHDLSDIEEICDRVVMIKDGSVVYNDIFTKRKKYMFILQDNIVVENILCNLIDIKEVEIKENIISMHDINTVKKVILSGLFDRNSILDIQVYENTLMELFKD